MNRGEGKRGGAEDLLSLKLISNMTPLPDVESVRYPGGDRLAEKGKPGRRVDHNRCLVARPEAHGGARSRGAPALP